MAKSALNSSCNGSKSRRTANRTNRKVVRPFLRVTECVQNWSFSSLYCKLAQHKGNHKGPYRKYEYIGLFSRFSTHIHTLLGSTGTVMWTGKLFHPKALLAVVGTVPTQTMILPPSIPAQEEHSFQVPFLASTHSPLAFFLIRSLRPMQSPSYPTDHHGKSKLYVVQQRMLQQILKSQRAICPRIMDIWPSFTIYIHSHSIVPLIENFKYFFCFLLAFFKSLRFCEFYKLFLDISGNIISCQYRVVRV